MNTLQQIEALESQRKLLLTALSDTDKLIAALKRELSLTEKKQPKSDKPEK